MYAYLYSFISRQFSQLVPATGIGLFRVLFGLVTLQEIIFLMYFNHLIFDPIPYLDVEFPMIGFFLAVWLVIAACLTVGYRCQTMAIANYLFWLVFVNFTPMQRDFDGGFDLFMIGANCFLLFMPIDQAFALDGLRRKLARPFVHYRHYATPQVSVLAYTLPVVVGLGFLYSDSVIHKLFAEHWRNGLGAWLPSTHPYYLSALDLSWWLDQALIQKAIGYTVLIFQITFLLGFNHQRLRAWYWLIGMALHIGITISLTIYPFGLGMLSFYALLMPFAWYRRIGRWLAYPQPRLTVLYDQQCPLCCRTILILNHFDVRHGVDFKGAQDHARQFPALAAISDQQLLRDLYAVDSHGRCYAGVATYAQILIAMGYPALLGYGLKLPLIFNWACQRYRAIADSRVRMDCDSQCETTPRPSVAQTWYQRLFVVEAGVPTRRTCHRLSKVMLVLIVLQLNCSVHYGLLYRFKVDTHQSPLTSALTAMSNAVLMVSHTFLGITPHALYLHDHFEGYERLLAITYLDREGQEQWLPFVNPQGRLLAPNWGRVHSMWANIAVTPHIDALRLKKGIMRVTAFWGHNRQLVLNDTRFLIKMKSIQVPFSWEKGLRNRNLSGEWQTIGSAQWQGKTIAIQLPADLEKR